MAQALKLGFANLEALQEVWDQQLKRNRLFIPSKRVCPVGTEVKLTLTPHGAPPLVLRGMVKVARSSEHCAQGQSPGFEVGFRYDRDKRKALRAYLKGDWTRALAVIPPEAHAAVGGSAQAQMGGGPSRLGRSTGGRALVVETPPQRAGSLVSVSRVKGGKRAPLFQGLDPEAPDFLEQLEGEARRQLRRFDGGNHYDTMGLQATASRSDIRKRYLQWMKVFHPDRYFRRLERPSVLLLEEVYQRVTEAYEVLVDEHTRAHYDQQLALRT